MAQTQSPYVPSSISTPLAPSFDRVPAGSPATQVQQNANQPLLPSPETFDIIPALHELINRLIAPVPGVTALQGAQPAFPNQQSLEIHQLANEVSSVRARIRKARKVVDELDDIDRSVEDQEAEMRALRTRIEKQKAVLDGLKMA